MDKKKITIQIDEDDFINGFAKVHIENKFNFVNTNGKQISAKWFDYVRNFSENGFAIVKLNGRYNFINTKGKLINGGKLWFDKINDFIDNSAKVGLNGQYNLLSIKGKLLSKIWFDDINNFVNGFSKVVLDGKYFA